MNEVVKILVIDDNEDDRLFYRRTLQKHDNISYNIIEADNGDKGISLIKENNPECILLDYSMPGRDGVEVLKQLRADYPFIPVVMLTGQGNEKVAVTAMHAGAQDYITKSTITSQTLNHVVHMAIEHCKLEKRIYEQRTSLEIFTRALAHDLKEPIRTIVSFTGLIENKEKLSDKAVTYFGHIKNAANRMYTLVDTVFMYTRLDASEKVTKDLCNSFRILGEVQENINHLIFGKESSDNLWCSTRGFCK